ncbi:MAG: hypothetical protein P0S94_02410 [Simkaniaceae bacterium]|nr:hypothetical protein [Simkaniaceae bacterium]
MTRKKKLDRIGDMGKNDTAEFSDKTLKLREKLKRHYDEIDDQVTDQALRQKVIEIHRRIERRANERVLARKTIALFDQNQNAASYSQRVAKIVDRLKVSLEQ